MQALTHFFSPPSHTADKRRQHRHIATIAGKRHGYHAHSSERGRPGK